MQLLKSRAANTNGQPVAQAKLVINNNEILDANTIADVSPEVRDVLKKWVRFPKNYEFKDVPSAQSAAEDYLAAQFPGDAYIRRGNRRGSITGPDSTNGVSTAKLRFLRNHWKGIAQEVSQELAKQKIKIGDWTEFNDRMMAYASTLLRVGNCGEFAKVVHWWVVENTKDKWVYQASMRSKTRNFDHAFNITYHKKVKNARDFDPEKATVVDGWDNYHVCTLKQFFEGANPYGDVLKPGNVDIITSKKSDGQTMLTGDIEVIVAQAIINALQTFDEKTESQKWLNYVNGANAQGIFDFFRISHAVDDQRFK
ncbi:hypothetical protein CBW65_06480 [Tumebacillus avium]|uniref:Uncharacterized protein n=1 Tax=Tumebacillus avium TaxID=1903704 RepID=A0A1Y0IMM7_9BACL|nr:hypothetical protein [Tumebacillus avium]ARU60775.1 hypothetical protein CBW65_06480 [Tumebacillus avium]